MFGPVATRSVVTPPVRIRLDLRFLGAVSP
jgi:hypothetical protein